MTKARGMGPHRGGAGVGSERGRGRGALLMGMVELEAATANSSCTTANGRWALVGAAWWPWRGPQAAVPGLAGGGELEACGSQQCAHRGTHRRPPGVPTAEQERLSQQLDSKLPPVGSLDTGHPNFLLAEVCGRAGRGGAGEGWLAGIPGVGDRLARMLRLVQGPSMGTSRPGNIIAHPPPPTPHHCHHHLVLLLLLLASLQVLHVCNRSSGRTASVRERRP